MHPGSGQAAPSRRGPEDPGPQGCQRRGAGGWERALVGLPEEGELGKGRQGCPSCGSLPACAPGGCAQAPPLQLWGCAWVSAGTWPPTRGCPGRPSGPPGSGSLSSTAAASPSWTPAACSSPRSQRGAAGVSHSANGGAGRPPSTALQRRSCEVPGNVALSLQSPSPLSLSPQLWGPSHILSPTSGHRSTCRSPASHCQKGWC